MGDDAGLDMAVLRAMAVPRGRASDAALEVLRERIADHLTTHDGYVAFSGGKDSLIVLDLVRSVEPDVPVVFFDSGLEYPQTYTFVRDVAQSWNLDLHVIASDPPLLEVLVASGQWAHGPHRTDTDTDRVAETAAAANTDLRRVLIDVPAARAHQRFGPGELWGVRADESTARRMLYTRPRTTVNTDHLPTDIAGGARPDGVIARADGTVAFGPIWNWSTEQVWAHIARQSLPTNPVYDILTAIGVPEPQQRVSHVIDGDHLHRGRLTWLRRGWPELYELLADALPRIRHLT